MEASLCKKKKKVTELVCWEKKKKYFRGMGNLKFIPISFLFFFFFSLPLIYLDGFFFSPCIQKIITYFVRMHLFWDFKYLLKLIDSLKNQLDIKTFSFLSYLVMYYKEKRYNLKLFKM